MKKLIAIVVVVVAIAAGMIYTRPEKTDHVKKINQELSEGLKASVTQDNAFSGILVGALFGSMGDFVVDALVDYQDKTFYSICTINDENGEKKTISLGVFGNVFTFSEKDVMEAYNNALKGIRK